MIPSHFESVFAVAIGLGPIGWSVAIISGLGFVIMFGIASAKGDFKGVIESSLAKPANKRKI